MSTQSNSIPDERLQDFLAKHRLPVEFEATAREYYEPLAVFMDYYRDPGSPYLVGINGAQGTGKSTLAEFLEMAVTELYGWRSAVLSIDDFYLTRAERARLAEEVHPLFATRGVPGTHDTALLDQTLDTLMSLGDGEQAALPRFDKASDDRAPEDVWPVVSGPLDLILLEGWCVDSVAEDPDALREPVNDLERFEDPDAVWRTYANQKLEERYMPLFSRLHALIYLAAPSFDAILTWRLEQEHKLAERVGGQGTRIMSDEEVARFIRYYERITRHNLRRMPRRANAVLTLAEDHSVTGCSLQQGEEWIKRYRPEVLEQSD
ncbi:MAG: kinase [Woeseiaceae bacterium]|nr:kinase [Woeseiaceae bacterium]